MKKLNLNGNAYLSSDYYRKRENDTSKDLEKGPNNRSHLESVGLNYQSGFTCLMQSLLKLRIAPISFRDRRKMILLQKNATRDETLAQEAMKQRGII